MTRSIAADVSATLTDGARRRILERARQIVSRELDAAQAVLDHLDDAFANAVLRLASLTGRVAVTGMGKAGLIGQKIAATLSSTGTPAYVLHPAEALHGDLGMVRPGDIALALTNSGETDELIRLLKALRELNCPIILITGRPDSTCARLADIVLSYGPVTEACPLGLAPSASTTAMLVMGDALALAVLAERDFKREQYARFHPGGELGRSLRRVHELMRTGPACPVLREDQSLRDYAEAIRQAGEHSPARASGAVAVVDGDNRLVGFFTDGDLRRLIHRVERPGQCLLRDVMTRSPRYARADDYVADAARVMREYRIDELPVIDEHGRVVGMLDIQDLLAAGFSVFDVA